jgi:hypothetical protein
VLFAVGLKNLLGYWESKEAFDWKQFVVSTVPAFVVMGAAVFKLPPVLTLESAFLLFLGTSGLAEWQSIVVSSKKLGRAMLGK